MRTNPKVSIAMPVYNGGRYFEPALQSALAQTYANVEIVVVNDGSTDGGETDAIARRYADRITYIPQENRGVAGALNTAIRHMTGDIFTWLSHDDLYLPEKTAVQVDTYNRMGKRDAILCSDWKLIDGAGNIFRDIAHDHRRLVEAPMLAMLMPCINGCTIFIPRHVLDEVGPFEERYRFTQDYHLWNRILARYDFFHIPKQLILYREHPGQDSHKPGAAVEGDELWIRIMGDRSETERVQMYGSSKRFYERMGEYLSHSPYKRASAYALELSRTCIEATLVSVIVPIGGEGRNAPDGLRETVMSVLCQTHRNLEVLLVQHGPAEVVEPLATLDRRVRILRGDRGPGDGGPDAGLIAAAGAYIAFARPGSRFAPQKVARQLRAMQEAGRLASYTSYLAPEPGGQDLFAVHARGAGASVRAGAAAPVCLDSLMIHASLIGEGFGLAPDSPLATRREELLPVSPRHHPMLAVDERLSISSI